MGTRGPVPARSDQKRRRNKPETPTERRLRHAACLLADIGWRAHPDYRAETCVDAVESVLSYAISKTADAQEFLVLDLEGTIGYDVRASMALYEKMKRSAAEAEKATAA